jgi:hypothetical protein
MIFQHNKLNGQAGATGSVQRQSCHRHVHTCLLKAMFAGYGSKGISGSYEQE